MCRDPLVAGIMFGIIATVAAMLCALAANDAMAPAARANRRYNRRVSVRAAEYLDRGLDSYNARLQAQNDMKAEAQAIAAALHKAGLE